MAFSRRDLFRRLIAAPLAAALGKTAAITFRGVPIVWVKNLGGIYPDSVPVFKNWTSTFKPVSQAELIHKIRLARQRTTMIPPGPPPEPFENRRVMLAELFKNRPDILDEILADLDIL